MKTSRILFIIAVFLLSKDALSQLPCGCPLPVSPLGHYESIDPPTFIWIPFPYPPQCVGSAYVGGVIVYCVVNPMWFTNFYTSLQDSCYTLTNSQWNLVPPDSAWPWFIRTLQGGMTPCCPGDVRRLIGSLPPTNLAYPNNGDTGVSPTTKLDWTKIDSASSYRVHIYNTPKLNLIVKDTLVTRDSMFVPAGVLLTITNYWWRVKPYNARGEGPFSDVFRFTTSSLPSPPPAPVLVSPPNNSTGHLLTVTLTWNASPGAASYRVQAAFDSLFSSLFVNDSTVTGTSKMVSGLSILTKYFWRVNAKGVNGVGPWSQVWNFKTMGTPTQVTLLEPPNNSVNVPTSYTFRWSKAYDQTTHLLVSNYWFERVTDTVSMSNLLRDTTLTDTLKAVTGMSNSTSYYWRVKAKNQIGWGQFTTWWKFTTIMAAPTAPVLISPPNLATGVPVPVTFVWRLSLTAATYRLQVASDSLFNTFLYNDSTITDTTKLVSGLPQGTLLFWRVNAKNIGGISPFSAIWRFTTLLPPAVVTMTVIPGGFYNTGTGQLNMRDTIKVLLVDSAACTRVDSTKSVLDSLTFSSNISFTNAASGTYYLYVYHRNHIVISSRYEQNIIRGSTVSYDFTTDSAKTYGFNMIKVSTSPVRWGMIPGDANKDGYVDGLDQTVWILQNGLDGYLQADFNGDLYVDGLDQTIWIFTNGLSYVLPCELLFENLTDHSRGIKTINNKEVERIFSPERNKK